MNSNVRQSIYPPIFLSLPLGLIPIVTIFSASYLSFSMSIPMSIVLFYVLSHLYYPVYEICLWYPFYWYLLSTDLPKTKKHTINGEKCETTAVTTETWPWCGTLCAKHSNRCMFNPFTPESDQVQISPVASQVILHHTVWRTWLFIAYSDWKILVPVLTTSLIHFSWKGWENVLFELGIERVNKENYRESGIKFTPGWNTEKHKKALNSTHHRQGFRAQLRLWRIVVSETPRDTFTISGSDFKFLGPQKLRSQWGM